jgi:hypothetical protein
MDDLDVDRALQSVLKVEASPEFVACVRARIAEEPRPSYIAGLLKPAVAIACVVVTVVAVGLREDARLKPRSAEIGTSPATVTAGLSAVAREPSASFGETRDSLGEAGKAGTTKTKASIPRVADALSVAERTSAATEPPMPEVIVAPADIKALQEVLTGVDELRFVTSFDAAPTPWAMNDLAVPPITIEPLELAALHNN